MNEIAKRIKDTIDDSKYKQTEIAEKLEVSRRQIQRWINADQEMGIYKLKSRRWSGGVFFEGDWGGLYGKFPYEIPHIIQGDFTGEEKR